MWTILLNWFGGGPLTKILKTVENSVDNETERQRITAAVIETHVKTAAETRQVAMQSRMFWHVWALFAAPLGLWWAAVMIDTVLPWQWAIPDLPLTVKPWAETIFQSIFGSGAAVGAAQAIGSAIRGCK